ncbi:MAG: 2-oxoacid:acceptor oxidoreductase subunit alpha, partial [Rhizobiales bacterium]|nr:2-oxoacid:acceptor oxidoreductase subunit alpha [Hyphomicrobiales bacterium]
PVVRTLSAKSRLGVINIGSTDLAVREALERFASEGHGLNHMRIRAFPFTEEVTQFIDNHDFLFVVEQNRDAQLRTLLTAEAEIPGEKLVPILNYDGMPLTASGICDAIRAVLNSNPQVEEAVAAPLTVA